MRPPGSRVLSGGVLVVVLAACGSSGPQAAEPADAPPGTATPTGVVVHVAPAPEGLVYDPVTRVLAVAVQDPARLLLLDPATMRTRTSVALPAVVRHLQLAGPGGPVLVPCQDADELLQVGLPDGHVLQRTTVQSHPHDAAAVPGLVVTGNEFGHSLSVLSDGRVRRTISGVDQPGGVVATGSDVAIIDVGRFTVAIYDPGSGRRLATAPAGSGPTHGVVTSTGGLVVVDTRGDRLLTFSVDPLRRTGSTLLPGAPYGIAIDTRTDIAWVTLTARNEVVGLDVSGPVPKEVARYPTVEQPNTVAVAPGSHLLWVTGTRDGELQRITR